jgi:hypothetical protein
MDYKASKRNWKSKQQEGTGYQSSTGPKKEKKSGREEFKKDVADAVAKGTKRGLKKPVKAKVYKGKKGGAGGLSSWSVAELRKLLNQKKLNLLTKAGFPDGKMPRSKVGMIALCKRLKRKRW